MGAPAVHGPGLVHRKKNNVRETLKAALTQTGPGRVVGLPQIPAQGVPGRVPLRALTPAGGAWTIVPAMHGLNAICCICCEIIS